MAMLKPHQIRTLHLDLHEIGEPPPEIPVWTLIFSEDWQYGDPIGLELKFGENWAYSEPPDLTLKFTEMWSS